VEQNCFTRKANDDRSPRQLPIRSVTVNGEDWTGCDPDMRTARHSDERD